MRGRWPLLLALAAGQAACGPTATEAHWTQLAQGFRLPPAELARTFEREGDRNVRITVHENVVALERPIDPGEWVPEGEGLWSLALPGGAFTLADPASLELRLPQGGLARSSSTELSPGEYAVEGERLRHRPLGTGPPESLSLACGLVPGREIDGRWCALLERGFGPAIPVLCGRPVTVAHDGREPAQLRAWVEPVGRISAGARLRVSSTSSEALAELPVEEAPFPLSVPVPAGGRSLTFELTGSGGQLLLAGPVVGPARIGAYPDRPWPEARRNVVLFIADTLRADGLGEYGGAPGQTPHLDRVAARSVRFLAARSAASWTLPSIASILTGRHVPEHGADSVGRKLSEDVETLAEVFGRNGYRTGAVTDGVFFSAEFGLSQGFEWFCRNPFTAWNLGRTLDGVREFLARDDGRPVFLVIHTFRVHTPYRTGVDEERAVWEGLLEEGRAHARSLPGRFVEKRHETFLHFQRRFHELYGQGVRALDQRFGELVGLLEERGVLPRGLLAFCSDHGEAFGEHGEMLHGGDLWDVKLRVPLILCGDGLAARPVEECASLVDLGTTLLELAGLPEVLGRGQSLLRGMGAPTFSFDVDGERARVAICDGPRKILAELDLRDPLAARQDRAFDLGPDPGEENNLVGAASWVEPLWTAQAQRLTEMLVPVSAPQTPELSTSDVETLHALGYGGE